MIRRLTIKLLGIRKEILLLLTIILSFMGIAGWAFNIPLLKGDFHNYIPVAPMVSISFFLLSLSIIFIISSGNKVFHSIARITLLFIFAIVMSIFMEHLFNLNIDIEKVFGKNEQPFGNVLKGRMSPVTSILFMFIVSSWFLNFLRFQYLKLSGQVISILLCTYSFLLITGYVYSTPFLYTGKYIPVSLPTSLSFFLISLASIDFFRPNIIPKQFRQQSSVANRLAKAFLPISVIIVVVHGFMDANIFHTASNPALSAFILLLTSIVLTSVVIYNISKNIGLSIENVEKEKLEIQKEKHLELQRQNEEYYALYEEYKTTNEELYHINEELAKTGQLLKESVTQYQSLFENMINGFAFCRMIFDQNQHPLDFVYLNVNSAFEKLTGLKNVIGKPVSEVIPGLKQTDPEIFNIYGRVALGGESEKFEMFVEALKMWFSVSVFCPQKEHFVAVFDVITERKIAEEQLIIAKEKAEESDKLKTAFLQNMSHEIRTPMNAIMGFSQLLPDNFNKKDKLELFSNIINQRCVDLLEIINEILDISKIESGQVPLHFEECDLKELFDELYNFFIAHRNKIEKQHIQFYVNSVCDPAQSIVTDCVKLKQILINLINNAFKFTNQGKIEAGCKFGPNQELIFYVSDTGLGISREKQSVIFNRFTQVNEDGITNKGGTGLGLAIVKGLIIILGGEIWLDSEPGKGSTFSFSIPYKTIAKSQKTKESPDSKRRYNFMNKTLLIVEDDHYNAAYIKEILKSTDCNILHSEFGKEAVELSIKQPVDVVLMDIGLPDIEGYHATQMIKNIKPNIKIIAQTAFATLHEKEKCLKAGCDDYISKPIDRHLLLEKIYKQLTKLL